MGSTATSYFDALPNDIIFEIYLLVKLPDLLALRRNYTSWSLSHLDLSPTTRIGIRRLFVALVRQTSLPLDLPRDVDPDRLTGAELQPLVVKAARLDHNWRKSPPRIRHYCPIVYGDGTRVDDMQLLPGGRWLATAERAFRVGHRCTIVNIWSLKEEGHFRRIRTFRITGHYYRFAWGYQKDDSYATLAICIDHNNARTMVLEIYEIPLLEETEPDVPHTAGPQLKKTAMALPDAHGLVSEVCVWENLVAVSFFDLEEDYRRAHSFLVINAKTGIQRLFRPIFTQDFPRFNLRIAPDSLLLFLSFDNEVVTHALPLPDELVQESPTSTFQTEDEVPTRLDTPGDFAISLGACREFIVSYTSKSAPNNAPDYITFLAFSALSRVDTRTGVGHAARVSVPGKTLRKRKNNGKSSPTPSDHARSKNRDADNVLIDSVDWPTNRSTSIRLPQIGHRRAVWIEQNWITEQHRLMKLSWPLKGEEGQGQEAFEVGLLLHPNPSLPFVPEGFTCMAFDETTGRLCVGLITGDLWVLDYS